jgi:hypothetical protein
MASQSILWVAIPRGFTSDGARARLTVFVSPRLEGPEATLSPFDFDDWPARLKPEAVEFRVAVGSSTIPARLASQPESRLWTALFDDQTLVKSYEPDATSGVYGTFRAAQLHAHLKAKYQDVCAGSPLARPSREDIAAAFADLRAAFGPLPPGTQIVASENPAEQRRQLASDLFRPSTDVAAQSNHIVDLAMAHGRGVQRSGAAPSFVPLVPDGVDPANLYFQLAVFHQQAGGTRRTRASRVAPRLDFHQTLTALTEYPELMRRLGLLLDLDIDPRDLPEATEQAPGRLRLAVKFSPQLRNDTPAPNPDTAYVFERGRVFRAASKAGGSAREVVSGLLNLRLTTAAPAAPQFEILQVDVHGAALRLIDLLARTLPTPEEGSTFDASGNVAPPPLRSSGISITRRGHAESLHGPLADLLERMSGLARGDDVTLFEEDLVRGYRVDVEVGDKWHSLHERAGHYTFTRLQTDQVVHVVDEGCVQPVILQPDPGAPDPSTHDPSAPNYVGESLFLWNGWSLAARRPITGMAVPTTAPPSPPAPPGLEAKLQAAFGPVDTSLPRLRFGQDYRFRLRVVDLAGHGLKREEADKVIQAMQTGGQVPPVLPAGDKRFRFRRFEPVPSPVVLSRSAPLGGESAEVIALRSNHDLTAAAFLASHPEYALAAERHVAPPKTSQLMAETFGLFDAAFASAEAAARMYELARREKGAFNADGIHPEAGLAVPYLPDPLAAGAALRNLPGVGNGRIARVRDGRLELAPLPLPPDVGARVGSLTTIDFGPSASWPQAQPFRLRLQEGAGAPEWNASERVLTVSMAKGERRTVRLSCHLGEMATLDVLGIWTWMVEWLEEGKRRGDLSQAQFDARFAEFQQLAWLGLWWMLTPYRELHLVHAIQQPLEAPAILAFPPPTKLPGGTFVYVSGRARVHVPTTGRAELVAAWSEWSGVDDKPVPREQVVWTTTLPLAEDVPAGGPVREGMTVFDPASGTIEYIVSPVEGVQRQLREAFTSLADDVREFVRDIRTLPQVSARLLNVANSVQGAANMAGALVGIPPWRGLPEALRAIKADIEDNPESGSVPDRIIVTGQQIDATAERLAVTAERARPGVEAFPHHEFGDTKHRKVTYRVRGFTRFPEYFPAEVTQDARKISRDSEAVEVTISSTARPAPPKVRYVVPTFGWETSRHPQTGMIVRRRLGGGLRVYLEGPWFSSGEGELLAVLLKPPEPVFTATLDTSATQWAQDPIWESGAPLPTPLESHFKGATVVIPSGTTLTVVAYPVRFDGARQLWCADVVVDPGPSYFPFIRLALARYQPDSMGDLHLSTMVMADFAQVAPDRTLTIVPDADSPDRFTITVEGRTYLSNAWREGDTNGNTTIEFPVPAALNLAGDLIDVGIEQRIPGTTDEAGWLPTTRQPTGVSAVKWGRRVPAGAPLWRGRVELPSSRVPNQFRIVVRESEHFLTDRLRIIEEKIPDSGTVGHNVYPGAPRLVYADAIEL